MGWCVQHVERKEIRVGRLLAEMAQHPDDLAAMQRGMIHHVQQDFPSRQAELASIGKTTGKFAVQFRFREMLEPFPHTGPNFGPRFLQSFLSRAQAERRRTDADLRPRARAGGSSREGASSRPVRRSRCAAEFGSRRYAMRRGRGPFPRR